MAQERLFSDDEILSHLIWYDIYAGREEWTETHLETNEINVRSTE